MAFGSSDPRAALPANYAFTAEDAGVHVFADVVLYQAGSQRVIVTDAQNPFRTGSATVTVSPAAVASFYLSAPDVVTAGAPFDLFVYALDAYGNLATNYTGTVAFYSSTDPLAVLPLTFTFTAGDQGVAQIPNGAALFTEGPQDLFVYDVDSLIFGTAYFTVLPG